MPSKALRVNSATPSHALLNELRLRAMDYAEFKSAARELSKDKHTATVVKTIAALIKNGFIEVTVCVTPRGQEVAQAADKRLAADFARVAIAKAMGTETAQ